MGVLMVFVDRKLRFASTEKEPPKSLTLRHGVCDAPGAPIQPQMLHVYPGRPQKKPMKNEGFQSLEIHVITPLKTKVLGFHGKIY